MLEVAVSRTLQINNAGAFPFKSAQAIILNTFYSNYQQNIVNNTCPN